MMVECLLIGFSCCCDLSLGHSRGVQCLGVSANTVVTGGSDHMVSVWKVHGNQLVNRQQHTDHRGLVTGVHVVN